MSGKTRTSLLSLTIIAVILFSAFGPTIAYADGGTTTETPAAEATPAPEEASTETTTEAEATEVPAEATPEATAESEGTEAEAASEEAAAPATEEAAPVVEEAAPAAEEPVLTEVPEDTTITVVDASGEVQPLATQEAAEAIATSDPIWCPAGASPTPGANGCTGSFTSFDELLTFLSGNATYQGEGTIYVEQGAYQGSDPGGVIDFNAPTYDLSNIRNSNLTVTGGWNPGDGSTTSTSNLNNTRIIIGSSTSPWGGSVAINNITMTFSQVDTIPATPENGLTVYSAGDVALTNVDISVAPSAGAEIEAAGNVSVTDSKFHRNKTAGAIIRAGGDVNILNSEFQNPRINRQRRQIVGLDVNSGANVSLSNVLASGNREEGADIVAAGKVTIGDSVFNGTMEIVDTEFRGFGLRVATPDEININNVTANNNFLWGAWLQGDGPIAVAFSVFNANTTESPGFIDDTGIFIYGGDIVSLSNVQASQNRLYGAWIESVGNVSITQSVFNDNQGITNTGTGNTFHGQGLYVDSDAAIAINNSDASGNMLYGGQLIAAGSVDVANSTFNNNTTGSDADAVGQGLDITSGGAVSLVNVVLNNNQANGATVETSSTAWLENVTANDNGGDGVAVQASCVFLLGGNYSGNGQYGLNLGSSSLSLLASPTFSGNGAGDMNPENPPTCSFATSSTAAANVFTSAQVTSSQTADTGSNDGNVSLNQFMARSNVGQASIFVGKYAYVDSDAGLQIYALVPATELFAMD
ncbi:MAG TPA: right-handed parallel beta-helix repeat-containing protein [Anaerolineales bacterium]|nr:right-handed parallel beta-helix repeat-containing protein [Anaerolineales bacterium]